MTCCGAFGPSWTPRPLRREAGAGAGRRQRARRALDFRELLEKEKADGGEGDDAGPAHAAIPIAALHAGGVLQRSTDRWFSIFGLLEVRAVSERFVRTHTLVSAGRALVALSLVLACPVRMLADDAATRLYLDAVMHHTAGQVDQALLDVANAPPETFWNVARNLNSVLAKSFREIVFRNAMRRRAVLLHSDIVLLLPDKAAAFRKEHAFQVLKQKGVGRSTARQPADSLVYSADGQYLTTDVESGHWSFASWILTCIQPDPDADEFVRAWYRAVAATFLNADRFGSATYHLQRAREVLPRDPVILFYAGATHEAHSAPLLQNVLRESAQETHWKMMNGTMLGDVPGAAFSEESQLKDAERTLREAVKNGAPPEAQLHLGRVLSRLGKHADAVTVLEQVTRPTADARLSYLRDLLLGTEYSAVGRFDDARACFERAANLFPTAQSPLIALSDAALRAGDRQSAQAALGRIRRPARGHDATKRPMVGILPVVRIGRPGAAGDREGVARRAGPEMKAWVVALAVVGLGAGQAPMFRTDIETIRVDVLVTKGGRPVADLRPVDFEVLDNGVAQRIEQAAFEVIPLNVVMAVDGSSSVEGDRATRLREASAALLAELKSEDRAGLVVFGEAVAIRSGLTSDLASIRTAIDAPFQGGRTSLVDAAHACLLLADSEPGRALVLMFSDGIEVSSYLSADTLLQTAKRSNAVVYGVSPRDPKRPPFLRELAEASGGGFVEIDSTQEIERTFKRVLDEFRHRYLLSYSPTGVARAGWHKLTVRVKSPGSVVKARPGYSR